MGNAQKPGFDFDRLEKYLGEQIPFMPKGLLKNRMGTNGSWIGDYVQDVLKRSFGDTESEDGASEEARVQDSRSDGLAYEHDVFETHNSVIVRVHIPDDVHVKNVKAYAGSTQLKLEQEPSRKKQYVKLPSTVDAGAAKAVHKGRVLEIRMPKLDEAEVFQEIRIRHQG